MLRVLILWRCFEETHVKEKKLVVVVIYRSHRECQIKSMETRAVVIILSRGEQFLKSCCRRETGHAHKSRQVVIVIVISWP